MAMICEEHIANNSTTSDDVMSQQTPPSLVSPTTANVVGAQGPSDENVRNADHSVIMKSLITEFNLRLNKELRSQTEDIASNVFKVVEEKLRSSVETYVHPGPNTHCGDKIMAPGSVPAPSTRGINIPQDVRIADAQANLQYVGSSCATSTPAPAPANARVAFHPPPCATAQHNTSNSYHPAPTLTILTGAPGTEGLNYHHDGESHIFGSNPDQLRNDPNTVLVRNENNKLEAFLEAQDVPHHRNTSESDLKRKQ